VYTLGNNHGGIVQADGQWYIFYHRQTNGTEFSRQGCAERIKIDENGKIEQVEITSCGLNGGPLKGSGTYPAAIACHLTSPSTMEKIDYQSPVMQTQTRITENQKVSFITAITGGTVIGYKYFTSEHVEAVLLELRGKFKGQIKICGDEKRRRNIRPQRSRYVWSMLEKYKCPDERSKSGHVSCVLPF